MPHLRGSRREIKSGCERRRTGRPSPGPLFPSRGLDPPSGSRKFLESTDFPIQEQALMIPISGLRARVPFPYVGLATAVLLLHAILVAIVPPNPYRAVFALAALFAVGYCTLALIVGSTIRLSGPEILAFSTGLTIFITSLSALGVSILGIPITVFAVVIVGLPIALGATLVLRPGGNPLAAFTNFTRAFLDFSDYSAAEKGAVAVLFAGIVAALVIFVSLAAVHYSGPLSPRLAIAAPDGAAQVTTSFNKKQTHGISASVFVGLDPRAIMGLV